MSVRAEIRAKIFRKPSGHFAAWISIGAGVLSFLLLALNTYTGIQIPLMFFVGVAGVMIGLAELLPENRMQIVGALRIGFLFCLLVMASIEIYWLASIG